MPLPPKDMPEGLSPEHYSHLGKLYGLMEDHERAMQAMRRAASSSQSHAETEVGTDSPDGPWGSTETSGSSPKNPEHEAAVKLGQAFGTTLLKMLQNNGRQEKILDEFIQEARKTGASQEQIDQLAAAFDQALASAETTRTPPPRDVPTEGLTAQEYYELGLRYKECGWTEQARDALTYAMESDPEGITGQQALRYLRSKIPRQSVPLAAERENIKGFNEMAFGDLEQAKQTFRGLIKDYPQFEWPYGNLGSIYIREGNLDLAQQTLIEAVQINGFYVNAWFHLCRANILSSKFTEARYCLQKVREIDPEDKAADAFSEVLAEVEKWETEHP